jgi:hypothetical protein
VTGAAAADSSATAHILDLLAAVPAPGDAEGNAFWNDMWKASNSACLIPANIGPRIVRALDGEPAGLADQILSATSEMGPPERAATAKVVGEGLAANADLGCYVSSYTGGLWLTDVEQTAWRVLLAAHTGPKSADQARHDFREGWKNA